ncbi:MAG: hypothetical protein Kow0090_04850 [Myxococcota bacterium]
MPINPQRLEAFGLFVGLKPEHLIKIGSIAEEVSYKKNEILFKEGDPGDAIYLIEDGSVRISKDIPNVGEEALSILKIGSFFGEMNLITGKPRSADARANEKVNLIKIENERFKKLFAEDKDLAISVLWALSKILAERLHQQNEKYRALLAMTVPFQ